MLLCKDRILDVNRIGRDIHPHELLRIFLCKEGKVVFAVIPHVASFSIEFSLHRYVHAYTGTVNSNDGSMHKGVEDFGHLVLCRS